MTVRLPDAERVRLLQWARDAAPREACGLLVGSELGEECTVIEAAQGDNIAGELDRFELDPMHVVFADIEARARGMWIVGVWHSHPASAAVPSERDRTGAAGSWPHLIVSPGFDSIRAWRLVGGAFVEDDLVR